MKNTTIKKDIYEQIERLPFEQQRQVLEFVRALTTARTQGMPGHKLLRFAGTIDREDLMTIEQAIKEGCEKVNLDEW